MPAGAEGIRALDRRLVWAFVHRFPPLRCPPPVERVVLEVVFPRGTVVIKRWHGSVGVPELDSLVQGHEMTNVAAEHVVSWEGARTREISTLAFTCQQCWTGCKSNFLRTNQSSCHPLTGSLRPRAAHSGPLSGAWLLLLPNFKVFTARLTGKGRHKEAIQAEHTSKRPR